jgi:molybdate transport system permease protein
MNLGAIDWTPLWLSLRVATLATLLAAITGGAIGYAVAEGRFPLRRVLEALTSLPLLLPPTVLGYYLLVMLGRRGPIGAFVERLTGEPLVFTWRGAVIAATVASFPYVARTTRAALEDIDPSLREAVRIDGASRFQQLVFVLLPLSRGGLAAGIALAFARSLGEFGATLMVAGNIPGRTQTMPTAIYDAALSGQWTTAGTLVAVLTAAAIVVLLVVNRLGASA